MVKEMGLVGYARRSAMFSYLLACLLAFIMWQRLKRICLAGKKSKRGGQAFENMKEVQEYVLGKGDLGMKWQCLL